MKLPSVHLTGIGRIGAWTAITGGIVAAGSAGALMLQRLGATVGPGYCPEGPPCGGYVVYSPFFPVSLGLVIVLTPILALLVLLRPRLWWAGAACVLAGAGSLGGLALAISLPLFRTLPYGSIPVLAVFVLLGAWVETLGFLMLRPEPVLGQPEHRVSTAGT